MDCLNSKLVQSGEIIFPPQMMTWTVKTMKQKVIKCSGNFSHLKDLISTYVNNISTSPSEVETEDQPGPSSRSNSWFDKRLECPIICFKKFSFNDIESHASNCASKFDCNEIEVTYEKSTNEQVEVTIPL